MTREEMIEQLENTILLIKQNGKDWFDERDIPILKEAIEAMQMEPCRDYISRQRVLDIVEINRHSYDGNDAVVWIEREIKELPSVQSKYRTGHWVEKIVRGRTELYCSACGDGIDVIYEYNYCPTCGAKMEEGD